MAKPKIVVLGSLHLDVLVHAPDRPRKGETIRGNRWGLVCGGKGGNQAVQAAQQGAQVHMIGRVGQDDFAPRLLQNLRDAGVDTTYVQTDAIAGSGMSVAVVDAEGDYGAVIVSGANLNIGDADIAQAEPTLLQADCLVLQYEVNMDANIRAAQLAHKRGVQVILNAAPAMKPPAGLLEHVDVLVANETEAEMLSNLPVNSFAEARTALEHLRFACPTVIVTLGEKGVLVASNTLPDVAHIPAYNVAVQDTHGAGDAFIGALAARLARGEDLLAAVRFANAVGALMVMNVGPVATDMSEERVRKFLKEQTTTGKS